MKKLMLIVATLMIAGGISAHGYRGYDRDNRGFHECHERVIVRPYAYCEPRIIVYPAPVYYGYGYRHDCDRDRYYHGEYYSGRRCR